MATLSKEILASALKQIILNLERNKIVKSALLPIRFIRDAVWYHFKAKKSYRLLAQFFEPSELKTSLNRNFPADFLEGVQISSKKYPGLWNTNPTISVLNDEITIYLRATSWVFNPKTNSRGHNSLSTTDPKTYALQSESHSVVRNALIRAKLEMNGGLLHQELILKESEPPSLEDVRSFQYHGQEYLIGTWTNQIMENGQQVIRQSIAIYSVAEDSFKFLESPFGLPMEKNWIPIEVIGNRLIVFYSSQPAQILEVDLESDYSRLSKISSHPLGLNFHGRSQFIKLTNGNFLRVASLRLPIKDFGLIHFSFLIEHAPNYQEIRISQPFLFSTPGFEICNGLGRLSNNDLIFSWGCNDKSAYFAKVPLQNVMDWFAAHELKIRNRKSIGMSRLRKIFRVIETNHLCECKS